RAHPRVDLVQGGLRVIGDPYVVDFDRPDRRISIYKCAAGGTFFGKREGFASLGGFHSLRNYEDTDLWRRAERSLSVATLIHPRTYLYYRNPDSITGQALGEQRALAASSPSAPLSRFGFASSSPSCM